MSGLHEVDTLGRGRAATFNPANADEDHHHNNNNRKRKTDDDGNGDGNGGGNGGDDGKKSKDSVESVKYALAIVLDYVAATDPVVAPLYAALGGSHPFSPALFLPLSLSLLFLSLIAAIRA